MDAGTYVDAVEREGGLLAEAATDHLQRPIAVCPGWVVADVVGHLGRVYRSVTDIVGNRLVDQPTTRVPKPPAGDAVVEFFTTGLAGLVDVLRATPADVPVLVWGSVGTVGFYHRRMAHETAVHRFDVQTVCGAVDPFDADMAADGISELYDVVLPFGLSRTDRTGPSAPAGSLHLHRTDGAGEWTLQMDDGALHVSSAHGKATAAVRGPGSDLFVFAWNRGRSDALEVFGDVAAADAWGAARPVTSTSDGQTAVPDPAALQAAAVRPRGFGSSGAFDSIGSVAVFMIGNKLSGLGVAITLVTAWSLVAILRRHRSGIGVGKLLPITTAYLIARGVVGLATGSKAVYFGTSIATKVGIGLVLVGSVVIRRVLLPRYAPLVIPFPAFVLAHQRYYRTLRNLTVLAGIYEIGTAIWDVWLYNRTSTNGFVLIRLGVSWVSGFVVIFGAIIYADASLRKIPGFEGLLAVMEELTESLSPRRTPG